jgi:7,8-dihydropterin-6-yl-methyl-4-(beta-D-ribofuranosyl)aminobenzene 5'-phosphate synthase
MMQRRSGPGQSEDAIMRRFKWGWLLALVVCLGGSCTVQPEQMALVPPSPSPWTQPPPTQVMATVTVVPQPVCDNSCGGSSDSTPSWMIPIPVPAKIATHTLEATPMPRTSNFITLTIVYDNLPLDARLKTAWGFACLVETGKATVLFDTGGGGPTLMNNLAVLGFEPRRIDAIVLSHIHDDHVGGLDALLSVNGLATVFVPRSFPDAFKTRVSQRAPVIQVREPMTITQDIRTTGEIDGAIIEQALIVQTNKGLVVITGCAHPGIVEIARRARAYGDIYLIMGGFHLGDKSAQDVEAIIAELKRLGVHQVAPSHCTGEAAIRQFNAAFGADFIQAGAGLRIVVPTKD